MSTRIVVTGGAGFIGSNFLRFMINKYPDYSFVNVDILTYSGSKKNVFELDENENYEFVNEDIRNFDSMKKIIDENDIVVNFAAESHVDNSIKEPQIFIETNVLGTHSVLEAAREKGASLFVQISTDEVYGSLGIKDKPSMEGDILHPSSPYSASKAAAEMICLGNVKTFDQSVIITRSSNNFGPYQFPEKVIPLFVTNLINDIKIPLYGTGKNVRDWIYVIDNCEGIDYVIHKGKSGEIYNIGGGNELQNIELTKFVLKEMGFDESYIDYVEDRKGHDLRYSLNCSKIHELGWRPRFNFEESLLLTIEWYKNNKDWWSPLKNIIGKRTS
jgi:dTDP-glucose 4,6-dehydratase